MKQKLGFCPACEKTGCVEYRESEEIFKVNEEEIPILTSYYVCNECGVEIEDPFEEKDPVSEAYRIYKKKHNMLQAEEIKELRKKYGLTQGEFGKLLGIGAITISRYENGCLQTKANDNLLRNAQIPGVLLGLLEKDHLNLSDSKRKKLKKFLMQEERQHNQLEYLQDYEPSIYSGFQQLSIDKVINAILFFCRKAVVKTKLNKLLFYADFKFFKEFGTSITGLRYARIQHGPVPDKYQTIYAILIDELEVLDSKEVTYNAVEDVIGEEYVTVQDIDFDLFDVRELRVLSEIAEKFDTWTAKKISDYSHEEEGWLATEHTKYISYEHAEKLSI